MFATRLTEYDIVDAAPYHLDPIKALADACHAQGIKLFFTYSLRDWHHPDYFPLGKSGQYAGREPGGDWKRYVAYYQGQIRELCANYGEVGGIWFEGREDRPDADWDLADTCRLIHELQPSALVGRDDGLRPIAGEDIQPIEPLVSGRKPVRSDSNPGNPTVLGEARLTINDTSEYHPRDHNFKSAEAIIHALVNAAGVGANLRLSVAMSPDGTLGSEVTQRLLDVGKWLDTNGDSVHGTRRGPFPPRPWGVWTARGTPEHPKLIYIHILAPTFLEPIVFDPSIPWTPSFHGKSAPLKMRRTAAGLVLDVPKEEIVPVDTIIVLTPGQSDRP